MKKLLTFLVVGMILVSVGVFAAENTLSEETKQEIETAVKNIVGNETLGENVKEYVEKFAEKRNVNPNKIKNISEVDFDKLPKEVNIENVGDTNLAIYQVDYEEEENTEEKQLFVITYSTEKLKKQGDIIIAHDKRQFLNFGSVGELSSGFLQTATGIEGSLEAGYVMMREGSITGISTNLEVVNASSENIRIVVYKNGEAISFGNSLNSDSGIQKDYDVQSNDVVKFQPGDVISAYAVSEDGAVFKNVITMVEITTK